ncbi:hypothetical protein SAMN05660642_04934, partial [Geodermatophilus siccatus]
GYDLADERDRAFAFDFDHSGRLDHIALYRPGRSILWMLNNSGGSFGPVSQGLLQRIDFHLSSNRDRVLAFDYKSSGAQDYVVLNRPGAGIFWIVSHPSYVGWVPAFRSRDPANSIAVALRNDTELRLRHFSSAADGWIFFEGSRDVPPRAVSTCFSPGSARIRYSSAAGELALEWNGPRVGGGAVKQQLPGYEVLIFGGDGANPWVTFHLINQPPSGHQVQAGMQVWLMCSGDMPGPRWLDGVTPNGSVILSLNTSGSGSRWRVHDAGGGGIHLECLGDQPGPRWLDGVTGNGSVVLSPDTSGSGSRWRVHDAGGGGIHLECLGDQPGPRWLDGVTGNGSVVLSPDTSGSGSRWVSRIAI